MSDEKHNENEVSFFKSLFYFFIIMCVYWLFWSHLSFCPQEPNNTVQPKSTKKRTKKKKKKSGKTTNEESKYEDNGENDEVKFI